MTGDPSDPFGESHEYGRIGPGPIERRAPSRDAGRADHRDGRRHRLRPGRLIALALVVAAVAAGMPAAIRWVDDRRTHSITDDAFVEAHIVNIAPQLVSGRIVRFLADEDDRVVQGQVLAEIDPIPYRDKVNVARAQLDSALAELDRQRADLARTRKEVPIQIEIARRTFASAGADRARAEESLKLTEDDVEKGIDEARAEVKAVNADLVLAVADHARVANLEGRGSATRQELDQMVRARDAARAHVELAGARLARALSARTQVDVARRRWSPPRSPSRRRPRGSTWRRSATTGSASSSCWSRSRSGPSIRPGGPWRPPRTTWRTPTSAPPSPAWWSSDIATWATIPRPARRS